MPSSRLRPATHSVVGEKISEESEQSGDTDAVALTRSPGFWPLMRYAVLFGVVLAFAALAYLGLVSGGTDLWFTLPKDPGWLDGNLWWVAVTAGAGVAVGVLRRVFRLPTKLAGTVEELRDQRVEPSTALQGVAVSAGVAGRRREPWAGGGTGDVGRGPRNLGVGATGSRRRHAPNQHAQRHVGGVRRSPVVSDSRDDSRARARTSQGGQSHGHTGCRAAVLDGRVRRLLPDRGVDVRRDLLTALLRVRGLAVACGRAARARRRSARADHGPGDRDSDRLTAGLRQRTILCSTIGGILSGWSASHCR